MVDEARGIDESAAQLLRGMQICRAMLRMRIFEIDDGWHDGEDMGIPIEFYRRMLAYAMVECEAVIRVLQDKPSAGRSRAGRKPRGPRSRL